MLTGSCHCRSVAYEISGPILRFSNCHCDDCRKISGAAYNSALVLKSEHFKITKGEGELTAYESSPGKHRCFCKHCSSPIYAKMEYKPDIVIVRAGTLDESDDLRPQMHIWVKAKAPWYEILDKLPQYQEGYKP